MKPPEETDTFQYEPYYSLVVKRQMIIWDYRDKKGILHSGVVKSLVEALEKAKKFGYQSNETAESKSQHDLVRKSYTHKSPSKIKRKIKCACLTTLIAAARPVIDAISVCSSCGRAVCNKCVYIGRTIKCACLTTLIAAARPVIDAISVCSSCGRAACNKCVYIGRTIKCACLTTLIAAARPVIDAISVCSSCGRAVCNKCVYIGRTLFRCQACGDSEFKIKKTLTERIRKSHSTWTRRCLRAIKKNEFDILAACFCVCLLTGSIKEMYAGAKKEEFVSYDLTSELEDEEIAKSAIYTGVLAGAVPFAIANFVMLHNAIYTKKYNI